MTVPHIRILGPVELSGPNGAPLALAGAKRRAALALLALNVGQTVPVERFLGALWESEPPAQAKAALQGHIAALRKALAGSGLEVRTRPGGYELVGDPGTVDAYRFEALLGAASAGGGADVELLDQALALWRGPALTDLPDSPEVRAAAERLEGLRLRAVESWARALTAAGQAERAVPELERAVAAHPVREPLAALLMRTLDAAGRRAEAVQVYHRTAGQLAEELGADPGESLRRALRTVSEPAVAPERTAAEPAADQAPADTYLVPSLLPRPLSGFVERVAERSWLDRLAPSDAAGSGTAGSGAAGSGAAAGPGGPGGQVRVAVVAGAAGSGKTSLVVRWAHAAAGSFPDGQLYADLRGFNAAGPADPADLLHGFLRAMGVREDEIPDGASARAALYREQTRGRKLLVVLDNALAADDVELLLPDGAASLTVVCSRHALNELLVREAAAFLQVGPFSAEAAREMVERRVGRARAVADEDATRRLVELCGRLPLALSIALARLASRPGWTVADLVGELEDERMRLSSLGTPGEISVARELMLSRRQLPTEGARLLPLVALHPGTQLDALAAAALLGCPPAEGRRAVDALAALHLVTEAGPGRYEVHDLVRLYCLHLLAEELPPTEQAHAVARLADYYLAATAAANTLVSGRDHGQHRAVEHSPAALPRQRDVREALRWLGREEDAIRSLVDRCAAAGDYERAWRLADNVTGLFLASGSFGAWIDCATAGMRAAEHSADPLARPRTRASLGFALKELNRLDEAVRHLRQALEENPPDDPLGRVRTLVPLADAHLNLGEPELSRKYAQAALADARAAGDPWSEAYTLHVVCFADLRHGAPEEALEQARHACALLSDRPPGHALMAAMACEAMALGLLHRVAEAEHAWLAVIELSTRQGNDHVRAIVESWFGEFLAALGRPVEAGQRLRAAIELYRRREDGRTVALLTRRLEQLA
ncbi:BTAD domain-containing putative transcriptional regulator [Kitasatospora sp. NPDC049285]|uniref:AfsR/SARP family transcriptional regulator n=1 Tax=Kitasatospora sp. NPDC049285 TaxID=3157096 RepID=UPI003439EAE6